jgi:hypothetical protein
MTRTIAAILLAVTAAIAAVAWRINAITRVVVRNPIIENPRCRWISLGSNSVCGHPASSFVDNGFAPIAPIVLFVDRIALLDLAEC